ncbi:MAG: RNA 2'-phosphotransferase, partial [Actinomycetota bacterium]|nr:RNA 2'-phosphotransferase [Actinomycetota bacterium]
MSKLVSYALRHRPDQFAIELDDDGWAPVDRLIDALRGRRGWADLQPAHLEAMIDSAQRQRHELRNGRIRALYGHSLPGQVEHVPERAPGRLFHGTPRRALEGIKSAGLLPRGRQYVHLARRA